jgi:hypothetical protein
MSGVVATLLVEDDWGGRSGRIIVRARGNIDDDIAERIARTDENILRKKRTGGMHFDAFRFLGEVERFGFGRIS